MEKRDDTQIASLERVLQVIDHLLSVVFVVIRRTATIFQVAGIVADSVSTNINKY